MSESEDALFCLVKTFYGRVVYSFILLINIRNAFSYDYETVYCITLSTEQHHVAQCCSCHVTQVHR